MQARGHLPELREAKNDREQYDRDQQNPLTGRVRGLAVAFSTDALFEADLAATNIALFSHPA
jgi:hypothetical protein